MLRVFLTAGSAAWELRMRESREASVSLPPPRSMASQPTARIAAPFFSVILANFTAM